MRSILDAYFEPRFSDHSHGFRPNRGCHTALSGVQRDCFDNAVAESFFATLKRELIHRRAWPTRAGLRQALFDYIERWYNTRRLHSSLGYRSPAEYEAAYHDHGQHRAA